MTKDEAEVITKIVDLIKTVLERLDKTDERILDLYNQDKKILEVLGKMVKHD